MEFGRIGSDSAVIRRSGRHFLATAAVRIDPAGAEASRRPGDRSSETPALRRSIHFPVPVGAKEKILERMSETASWLKCARLSLAVQAAAPAQPASTKRVRLEAVDVVRGGRHDPDGARSPPRLLR